MFSSERAIDVCELPQSASGRRTDGGAVCRGVRGMPYGAGEGGGGVPTEPEAELLAVSHGEEHAATAFDLYGSPDPSLWEDSLNGFAGGEGGGDTVDLELGVAAGGFGFGPGGSVSSNRDVVKGVEPAPVKPGEAATFRTRREQFRPTFAQGLG